uniref:Uncharacterized protein n=1 Tax=Arundo donax TaxID=35708 RepID=A0A0A9H9J9_ARUDO
MTILQERQVRTTCPKSPAIMDRDTQGRMG